jgi:hypothetical protein
MAYDDSTLKQRVQDAEDQAASFRETQQMNDCGFMIKADYEQWKLLERLRGVVLKQRQENEYRVRGGGVR